MKLLNLTAALLVGGALQAQNPLPAIHPQPQEVTLSTNWLKAPHGFTLSGIQHPDEDAMRLIKETLSVTSHSEALPLTIKQIDSKDSELKRSGAYQLTMIPKESRLPFPTVAVSSMQHRHCNNWLKPTGKVIRRCHSVSSKTIPISPIVELLKVFTAIPGATPTASSNFVFMAK